MSQYIYWIYIYIFEFGKVLRSLSGSGRSVMDNISCCG